MHRPLALALCLLLAACATPRQACLRNATADLAVVDRLIAETEANLNRGFAIDREPYVTSGLEFCLGNAARRQNVGVGFTYCNTVETRYREVPRAIDRTAERRKLAELRDTRARLDRQARASIAACEARYPTG
jgi:hypothetical protein